MSIYLVFGIALLSVLLIFFIIKRAGALKTVFIPTDIGGIIYGGLVAVYSILLAFVVVIVWQQYQTTSDRVESEAAKLFNVYRYSYAFPDNVGKPIRTQVVEYATSIVKDEWPALEKDTLSNNSQLNYNKLWDNIYAIRTNDGIDPVWHAAIVNSMGQFGEARLLRLSDIQASIPDIMWYMLLVGGIIVILFAMLFKNERQLMHLFKILLFSVLIVFNLELVYLLDHPFKGALKITPAPFERILTHYKMEQK